MDELNDSLTMENESENKPNKKNKKKRIVFLMLLVLVLLIAGASFWFFMGQSSIPTPMALVATQPVSAKKTPVNKNITKEDKKEQEIPSVPEFGNLGEYARLEAEVNILQKKKEVVALQQEIQKLQTPEQPKGPMGESLSTNAIQAMIAQEVSRLNPKAQEEVVSEPDNPSKIQQTPVVFISIEGIDGSLVAKVKDVAGNPLTLKRGSEFRGGKVMGVSRNGIRVNYDGKSVFYPF